MLFFVPIMLFFYALCLLLFFYTLFYDLQAFLTKSMKILQKPMLVVLQHDR